MVAAGVMLHSMERQVTLRVIVERPPGDVDFGVQEGHGSGYKTVQKQRFMNEDLRFEFPIRVQEGKTDSRIFSAPSHKVPRIVASSIWTSAPLLDKQTHPGVVD